MEGETLDSDLEELTLEVAHFKPGIAVVEEIEGRKAVAMTTNGSPQRSLSAKEQKVLHEFKVRVQDLLQPNYDDHYLFKWLKARCLDVNKAETMLRNSIAFKEKMNIEHIRNEYTPPKVIQEYLTGGICGHDREGSPVRVEMFGYLDMRGLMASTRQSDLEKTKLLQCENIVKDWREQSKKMGRRVDGLTVIFDMQHVGTKSMWRPGLQMYLHLVKILEDNYPEMMKRMFVINAPRIFPLLWKICRPLISEDMKNKISVLGTDFKTTLLKHIEEDELPVYLGGRKTDPDGNPRCTTLICQGGVVPRSCYLSEALDTHMETVSVARSDKYKVEVDVDKAGSILRWEFRTDDFDLGFGVVFIRDGQEEEVVPVKRANCHQVVHDGSHLCEERGKYAVVFNNHYSWSRAKTLHFLVEIHTSDSITDLEVDQVTSGGSWTRYSKDAQITHL